MKIAIVGTGYVGLVSAVCFAEKGSRVICVDNNEEKIKQLNKGIMPIYENDLEDMLNKNKCSKRLEFTTDLEYAVQKSDIIIIAVGTPMLPNGHADLSQVESVTENIAKFMNEYKIIVNKSTVPVGTQKKVIKLIRDNQINEYDFDVVSNPEFLREGTAIYDTMHGDRIVIGTDNERARKIMTKLYANFNQSIILTSPENAEMIKYAANAFLATKISFINEIANICEIVGADVQEIAKIIGMDKRISPEFLSAGIGFGGACFPKDTKALIKFTEGFGYDFKIVKSVIEVNENQKTKPIEKLTNALSCVKGRTIGILGLAFKPNTDDTRESPAITIINDIQKLGGKIKAYDPIVKDIDKIKFDNIEYVDTAYDAVKDVDAVILVTEWDEFKQLDLKKVIKLMKGNIFIDGRNIYKYTKMFKLGYEYYCIGKKDSQYYKKSR
ncbi:UDP-glucose dehydrogenase family protein [Oceanirhabdus seepicola]|uniref:UDP-glucose dehydrogenase family protein n=1 Tax=Oceanirhabdus seepicola TaxID=2828781 RepID=UPI002032D9DA